ncbi:MAG TPA: two-component regulator propeller domain-containing protein [bacterium]|nr:two-component regulator propeller domain-containing protein [bacterium]
MNPLNFKILLFLFIAALPLYSETWETHTCKNDVQDLCCVGDYCWVATTGGVVKVNINDFSFEEFDQDDWPAGNSASAITSTDNQILLGLSGWGITFYDGINSINYTTNNSDLVDNHVTSIATDTLNRIWMGTWQGISMYNGNEWQNLTTENSLLGDNHINTMAVDKNNKVWCGTNKGLYNYDGTNWQSFTKANGQLQSNIIRDIFFESNNKLWLATEGGGVHYYENEQWLNYNKDNSGLLENYIMCAFVDSKNQKWFGTGYGRVYCYNDTTWTVFDSTNCILPFDSTYKSNPSATINSFSEDKNGNLWVGGTSGLFFYNGSEWRKVTISRELQTGCITTIAVDRQNNKWYGTNNGGVSVDRNGTWQNYDTSNSAFGLNLIIDIAVDSSGNVWIASNWGVFIYNGDSLRTLNQSNDGMPKTTVMSIEVDREGNVWLGTGNSGVYKYDGNKFTNYCDPDNKLRTTMVVDIDFDEYNNKWFCTSNSGTLLSPYAYGIARFDDTNWQFYNVTAGLNTSNSVHAVAQEDNGVLWFATANGVFKYDGKSWTNYDTENSGLFFDYVTSLTIDKKGRKWIASEWYGLCMYDDELWYTFSAANSKLIGGYIYDLATDKTGNVIIGTHIGVSIYKDTQTKITNKPKINIPCKTTLFQNYPNPFNSETTINYSVEKDGPVQITIYDLLGRRVQTLVDERRSAGSYRAVWNGCDNSGRCVASGIYFVRMQVGGKSQSFKISYLK